MSQNSRQAGDEAKSSTTARQEMQGGLWSWGTHLLPGRVHTCTTTCDHVWVVGAGTHLDVYPHTYACARMHTECTITAPLLREKSMHCWPGGPGAKRSQDPRKKWTFMSPHLWWPKGNSQDSGQAQLQPDRGVKLEAPLPDLEASQ